MIWILIIVLHLSPGTSTETITGLALEQCEDLAFERGGYCFKGE